MTDDEVDKLLAELAEAGKSPHSAGSDLHVLETSAQPASLLAPRFARLGARLAGYVHFVNPKHRRPGERMGEREAAVRRALKKLDLARVTAAIRELEDAIAGLFGN